MSSAEPVRVGYVLKTFPRLSETFILSELLAHQSAGLDLTILSLRPPDDAATHGNLHRLHAPVTYVPTEFELGQFMRFVEEAQTAFPDLLASLGREPARGLDLLDLYQAIWVACMSRKRGITHLHAHFASVSATVARLASRISGIPYSFTAHAKDIFHESVDSADVRRKLEDAAFAVTISEYNMRYLSDNYGSAASGLRKISNGLHLEQFRYSRPFDRPPKIVAVGRLIEKKGFADLIDACAALARQGRRFTCEIIGPGPLERELRAQANRLGLRQRLRLLGPLPQEQVVEHVQSAAMLVAPCVTGSDGNVDGLPTVLLEAMALGTPCVSTNLSGIPEIVQEGLTGLLVPERDPGALAAAIARLLDDGSLRVALAEEARHLIERQFNIERNSGELRNLFAAPAPSTEFAAVGVS